MKITRWVSYLLLFSCVVLLTPRTFWHSCSHSHFLENKKSSKKQVVSFNSKEVACTFCDFDLSLFTVHKFHFFTAKKHFFISFSVAEIANKEQAAIQSFLLRGPPAIC
jgi:hypothetical protein